MFFQSTTGLEAVIGWKSHIFDNCSIGVKIEILTKAFLERLNYFKSNTNYFWSLHVKSYICNKTSGNIEKFTEFWGNRKEIIRHQCIAVSKMAFEGLKFLYPNTSVFILGRDINFLIDPFPVWNWQDSRTYWKTPYNPRVVPLLLVSDNCFLTSRTSVCSPVDSLVLSCKSTLK